ncbi:hypothetical protein BS78_04G225100 [Paspalum vaginatum]|nr:hypothetical protein BS78_04G225100 [Paspalum vaginatum]
MAVFTARWPSTTASPTPCCGCYSSSASHRLPTGDEYLRGLGVRAVLGGRPRQSQSGFDWPSGAPRLTSMQDAASVTAEAGAPSVAATLRRALPCCRSLPPRTARMMPTGPHDEAAGACGGRSTASWPRTPRRGAPGGAGHRGGRGT